MKPALAKLPDVSVARVEPDPDTIEDEVIRSVMSYEDADAALEWLRQAKALSAYLATREGAQGPMLGAMRRIEARIGTLDPAPGQGARTDLSPTSDRGQKLAKVDDGIRADFRVLGYALTGEPHPKTKRTVSLRREDWRVTRRKLVRIVSEALGIKDETPDLPDGPFSTIVADPPWQLTTGPNAWDEASAEGGEALEYDTMTVEDICELDVGSRLAEDAHLYLWTTNRYLEPAYDVVRAWGFDVPGTVLVWCKTPRGVGLGDAYRLTTEFVIFARKGSLATQAIVPTTWFQWPRGRHSAKPDGFYETIEVVSPEPRLDMFARKKRPGWTAWGAEAPDGE